MSYLRLLHAAPDAPAIDIYVAGNLLAKNLSYKQFTRYIKMKPGTFAIKAYASDSMLVPVISSTVRVPNSPSLTVAAVGTQSNLSFLPVKDTGICLRRNRANVRFAHSSPNAPAFDITLPNGTVLFRNIAYNNITGYYTTEPGTYTLQIKTAGTNQVLMELPNIALGSNLFYTVNAIGLAGEYPPLETLVLVDGYCESK